MVAQTWERCSSSAAPRHAGTTLAVFGLTGQTVGGGGHTEACWRQRRAVMAPMVEVMHTDTLSVKLG